MSLWLKTLQGGVRKLGNKFEKDIKYHGSERQEIQGIFPLGARNVLDVGCGSGELGKALKEKGVPRVIGIELNSDAASLARKKLDKVYEVDAEKYPLDLSGEKFDVIIFADILEHLVNPWLALKKYRDCLNEKGLCLISVPNIRYYRVILPLFLRGEFKYESHGILDIDHLRFFTLKTMRQYLKEGGFKIKKVKRNFSGHVSALMNLLTLNIFADLFTRQYIILAEYEGGATV
jgi:2-polyprenyl-3-methyl-5-hydroxy-6-metoxy-1,4-benzoquinol methylase